jgi:hypothetical protein
MQLINSQVQFSTSCSSQIPEIGDLADKWTRNVAEVHSTSHTYGFRNDKEDRKEQKAPRHKTERSHGSTSSRISTKRGET